MKRGSVGKGKTNSTLQSDKSEGPQVFRPIVAIADAMGLAIGAMAIWIFLNDDPFSFKILLTLVCILCVVFEGKDFGEAIIIGNEYLILPNVYNNRTGTKEKRLELRWNDILDLKKDQFISYYDLVIKTRGNHQGYTKRIAVFPYSKKQFNRIFDTCTQKARVANPNFRGTHKRH